jgi:hypothetical protein
MAEFTLIVVRMERRNDDKSRGGHGSFCQRGHHGLDDGIDASRH